MRLETLIKSNFFYVETSLDGYRHVRIFLTSGVLA